ncbi:MAG: SHOCT domain-containing protein [Mobilitalea sp.]
MKSYVFRSNELNQAKAYNISKKHALGLKLINPETRVLLYVGTGNVFTLYPYIICTDNNVIIGNPSKLASYSVLPYSSISSCTVLPGLLPKVSFGMMGRTEIFAAPYLSPQDAQSICQFISEKSHPSATQTTPDNSFSDLEKLAELKDKGIITEEEFQLKKKQILGI